MNPPTYSSTNCSSPLLVPSIDQEEVVYHNTLNHRALSVSVWANVGIVGLKTFATVSSQSLAVMAVLVDSILDVVSQGILFYTENATKQFDFAKYPAGRSKLAPLGIFICAVLMGMASVEVIRESMSRLFDQGSDDSTTLSVSVNLAVVCTMAVSFGTKLGLYFYCMHVCSKTGNQSVKAAALDHLNDVLSIFGATAAAVVSFYSTQLSWIDPVSAVGISIYIMREWYETAKEQTSMIVGRAATEEFMNKIKKLGNSHHPQLKVDILRAYHFGHKYLVEIEAVLPIDMTLKQTHDIGMELQHKVEALTEVERAFVHIDYTTREYDEHNKNSWPDYYAKKVRETVQGRKIQSTFLV